MVQRPGHLSESGQEPNFPKKDIGRLFLLVRETGISLPLLLFTMFSTSMCHSLGIQHHGQSPGSPLGHMGCEQLSREKLPVPGFPLFFSLASSQPLTCDLKSHVALRKSLVHVVDRWPALSHPARWDPDVNGRGCEKGLLLQPLLLPGPIQRDQGL